MKRSRFDGIKVAAWTVIGLAAIFLLYGATAWDEGEGGSGWR